MFYRSTIMSAAEEFEIDVVYGEGEIDIFDDNVDVNVRFPDGRRFGATVFTPQNLTRLLNKDAQTAEHGRGLYFWAPKLVIVKDLSYETIRRAVELLISSNELADAFEEWPNDNQFDCDDL